MPLQPPIIFHIRSLCPLHTAPMATANCIRWGSLKASSPPMFLREQQISSHSGLCSRSSYLASVRLYPLREVHCHSSSWLFNSFSQSGPRSHTGFEWWHSGSTNFTSPSCSITKVNYSQLFLEITKASKHFLVIFSVLLSENALQSTELTT